MPSTQQRSEDSTVLFGTGVTQGCVPPCRCWELSMGSLQEHLLTTETSLQLLGGLSLTQSEIFRIMHNILTFHLADNSSSANTQVIKAHSPVFFPKNNIGVQSHGPRQPTMELQAALPFDGQNVQGVTHRLDSQALPNWLGARKKSGKQCNNLR